MNVSTDHSPSVRLGNSGIVAGILSAVLGAVVLAWPDVSIAVAAALFGAYLLVSGVGQVVAAFGLPAATSAGRVLMFISGAAALILAVLCFRDLSESILLLSIWIGVGFIFRGTAAVAMAVSDVTTRARWWLGLSGASTIVAGFVMLGYPITSLRLLALVAGAWLVVLGVIEIAASVQLRNSAV